MSYRFVPNFVKLCIATDSEPMIVIVLPQKEGTLSAIYIGLEKKAVPASSSKFLFVHYRFSDKVATMYVPVRS